MRGPFNYRFGLASPFYDNETGLSPADLFAVAGSRGFFYDFSDYTTQFADTAGTTAITGVGQSLGLVLDKSAGLALGPELITNGDFSGGLTGWTDASSSPATFTVSSGQGLLTSSGTTARARQTISTVAGRTYKVTFDAVTTDATGCTLNASGVTAGTTDIFAATVTTGTFSRVFVATSSTTYLQWGRSTTGTCTFDNVSVRELPGNHATQATAGSRALTQVRPMFTQRNRAVGSELVENVTYWPASSVQSGITATKVASGIDTDGLPYVDVRYAGTASSNFHSLAYTSTFSRIAAAVGQSWTSSITARVIAGSTAGVGTGLVVSSVEETAPTTYVGQVDSVATLSSTEVVLTATRAMTTGNQVRTSINLYFNTSATIDITYRIKGLMFELGSTRTTYQPAVSGELRNLMPTSGNPALWSSGGGTVNGITVTRVATGFDATGLPYADYSVSGTATATDVRGLVGVSDSRRAAIAGQTFTSSFVVGLMSGSAPPAGSGAYVEVAEENSSNVYLAGTASAIGAPATDTLRVATRTLSDPALAFVRGGVILLTASGATVNYTVRIKAPQFEQASTYSRYQRVVTANEWYEPGFTSYRGIRFDGVDDFLQTAAIDFAGAGISGSNILTGSWTLTVDGGTATATESPAGTLNLTGDGTNGANARQAVTTEVGKQYRVDCAVGSSAISIFIGTTSGGNNIFPTTSLNTGVNCVYFTATTTTSHITFRKAGAALSTTSGITVREAIVPADKMTVVAGVRKLSDAAVSIVTELTVNSNTENGSFYLTAPQNVAANFGFSSKGTIQAVPTGSGFPAPITAVQTGVGDISGDVATLRINGSQVAQLTSDQGTGNFANAPIFIGRRAGSSLPFNGVLTFLCVINRTLTAAELAQLETYANLRTGAY